MAKLSFILPQYDFAINKLYDEVVYALHMKDEILRLFPPRQVNHNGIARIVSSPDKVDVSMRLHKSKTTADPDMILQTDAFKFKDFLVRLIIPLLEQQREHTWETLRKTTKATGKNIDGKGRNYWEVYIEKLQEEEDVRFDEDGRPIFTLLLDSGDSEKKEIPPLTEKQATRLNELIESKWIEYNANKRSRRLY